MIEMGWCRPYTSKQINRIRHVCAWLGLGRSRLFG